MAASLVRGEEERRVVVHLTSQDTGAPSSQEASAIEHDYEVVDHDDLPDPEGEEVTRALGELRVAGAEVGEEGPVRRLRDAHGLTGKVEAEPVTAAICQTM